jgi:hypothetical protein
LQQEAALLKFQEGKWHVLVATDVGACGLDIAGVKQVLNMDLPMLMEDFDCMVEVPSGPASAGQMVVAEGAAEEIVQDDGLA